MESDILGIVAIRSSEPSVSHSDDESGKYAVKWSRRSLTACMISQYLARAKLPTCHIFAHTLRLDLSRNSLQDLPRDLAWMMPELRVINLSNNRLRYIPEAVLGMRNLVSLDVSRNEIRGELSADISNLERLEVLNISDNQLTSLPASIGRLTRLRVLLLGSECIGGNRLTQLPDAIGDLHQLCELDISLNDLHHLPATIQSLQNLVSLSATANQLQFLPASIGDLGSLRSLNLAQNRLIELPIQLMELTQLVTMDVSCNQIGWLPSPLLAFLECRGVLLAGNPLNGSRRRKTSSTTNYSSLTTRIPSLKELAARAIIKQRHLIQKRHLPRSLLADLASYRGGSCHVCDTVVLGEYTCKMISDDCLGFPRVSQQVALCSHKCLQLCSSTSSSASVETERNKMCHPTRRKTDALKEYWSWQTDLLHQSSSLDW